MASWFHCNMCYLKIGSSNGAKYVLTNCGHIFCDNCLASGVKNMCYVCHSECTTIALSANMTPDIQIFFTEYEESLQKLVKVYEFQKNHGKTLYEHLEKENMTLKHKYAYAKEYIKKLMKQHEALQKDHQRLRNLFKMSINSPAPGNNSFRRNPGTPGSVTSTPTNAIPNSSNFNRYPWKGNINNNVMNNSVSSHQSQDQFQTPSVYQSTPSAASGISGASAGPRRPQGRGNGAPNGVVYPRHIGYARNGRYNLSSQSPIDLDKMSFGANARHQPSGGNRAP